MDRRDAYHGQVVTEGDVDEWFDDVEGAEEQLAKDAGVRQATLAETPSSSIFGGILVGLTVTGVDGNDYVTVALGSARDDDGEHIKLAGAATVKLSHAGLTVIGEDTDAVGDGAAIAGGVCAAGQRVVLSLFACVARDQQDAKTDAGGATVYYDQLESFRFYLATGSADYDHANVMAGTETPTRAALANNYVLLCDIIAENSAGTMVFRAVMNTTPQWNGTYSPPGNYASLTGRRADWLALQTTDEFTTAEGVEDIVRVGTAREALYDLGRRVRSEAFTAHRTLSAPALFSMRKRFGHPCRPNEFFDEMYYNADAYDSATGEMGPRWAVSAIGGGLGPGPVANRADPYGSYVALYTNNAAGEGTRLYAPFAWALGAAPWAIGMWRVKVSHNAAGQSQQVGFAATLGVNQNQVAFLLASNVTPNDVVAYIYDSAGALTSVNLGAFAAATWYTLRVAVLDNAGAYFQLNNGAWTRLNCTGTLGAVPYTMYGQSYTVDGTVRYLRIDQAYAADAQLSADMA